MPTEHTAPVQPGQITEFKDFALQCAQSFGVPSETEKYHAERLAEAKAELARLTDQPVSFWEAEASRIYTEALARWEEKQEQRARYETMLAKVEAWTPPTPEHEGLKRFMVEQLASSIRAEAQYDPKPELKQWAAYKAERLAKLERDIATHTEGNRKEIESAEQRNRWLEALRASL